MSLFQFCLNLTASYSDFSTSAFVSFPHYPLTLKKHLVWQFLHFCGNSSINLGLFLVFPLQAQGSTVSGLLISCHLSAFLYPECRWYFLFFCSLWPWVYTLNFFILFWWYFRRERVINCVFKLPSLPGIRKIINLNFKMCSYRNYKLKLFCLLILSRMRSPLECHAWSQWP